MSVSNKENISRFANNPQTTNNQESRKRNAPTQWTSEETKRVCFEQIRQASRPSHTYPRDRDIPPRAIMDRPGVQVIHHAAPPPAEGRVELVYQRMLANALFRNSSDPYDPLQIQSLMGPAIDPFRDPILGPSASKAAKIDRPPQFRKGEIYTNRHTVKYDLPGLEGTQPAAYCPNRDLLAVCLREPVTYEESPTYQVVVFHLPTRKTLGIYPIRALPDASDHPTSVAFSKSGNYLVVGRNNGQIDGWAIEDQPKQIFQMIPALKRGDFIYKITSIAIHNKQIFAGAADGFVFKMDPKTERFIGTTRDFGASVSALAFSPSGQYMAIGGEDGTVAIRDANTLELIRRFTMPGPVRSFAFNPSKGHHLAIAAGDKMGSFRIINLIDPAKQSFEAYTESPITNFLWEPERLFVTCEDGTYQALPFKLHSSIPLGITPALKVYESQVRFAAISQQGDNRSLILIGDEQLSLFDLPPNRSSHV